MIIDRKEIDSLEAKLEEHLREEAEASRDPYFWEDYPGTSFLYKNPHLLLALGFDEYRLVEHSEEAEDEITERFPHVAGATFPLDYESIYRDEKSGEWKLFQGLRFANKAHNELSLNFVGHNRLTDISCNELISKLQRISENPKKEVSTLSYARFWTPDNQIMVESNLASATQSIISTIHSGYESLRDVKPRELEEIVAELLREQGLQIHVTPRTRDGGRDIVARGELLPGEPITLAVEVKNMDKVGVGDISSTLWRNRQFPALMLVTAGEFSSGVIEEKRVNSLRLILKDGVALNQWISGYVSRTFKK